MSYKLSDLRRLKKNELKELVNRSSLVVREKKLTKEKLIQTLCI